MKKALIVLFLVISALSMSACTISEEGSHTQQGKAMEENQKRLQQSYQIPQLEKSLEVENNHRRLEFLNKSDSIGYVYLLSHGKVITFYTVRGKVSSLNSYSTAMEQIVNSNGVLCSSANKSDTIQPGCGGGAGYLVQAPDIDGSYGKNVEGIYFFTTEGSYIEWSGEYMYTSEPLKISTPVELTRQIQ